MKLSRLLDQEDAVYAVISMVQQDLAQGNRAHLDGMLYALGCLCRCMDFLENEELVEVSFLPGFLTPSSYRTAPCFSRLPIQRSPCFSSFAISPTRFPPFLLSLRRFSRPFWPFSPPTLRPNRQTRAQRRRSPFSASRDRRCSPCIPCFVHIGVASHLDQLLAVDINFLRPSVVPSFLEGCCSVAAQLCDVRSSWFVAQLRKARCFPELAALKVLLSNAQSFASPATMELVNECTEVSRYLCALRGSVEKDECVRPPTVNSRQTMEVWKGCVSSLLHVLIQIDPPSLAPLSEMLLEGIRNSGNALFMTLFGDLLVTSASFNLYVHRAALP